MSKDSVVAVLGTLRRLKNTEGLHPGCTGLTYLQHWAGDHTPVIVLRLAIAIQNHVNDARIAIQNSSLNDEAKNGLAATLDGVEQCFSLGTMQSHINAFLPALDSSITNFSIIASLMDIEISQAALDEIDKIIADIDVFVHELNERDFDPTLKSALIRQLYTVTAMLRNAQAVGVEAALSAFFDIILRMKEDVEPASEVQVNEPRSSIWDRVAAIGDKLSKLATISEAGQKLLPYIEKVPSLLKYIPS